jgi:transposase-like protein
MSKELMTKIEKKPGQPLEPGQRWSVMRKREVALRILRGESIDALSRELGVELYRLERWRDRALAGIDASLRERGSGPLEAELDQAKKRIGELSMENELLRVGVDPIVWTREGVC